MGIIGVFPDWRTSSYEVDEKGDKTAVAVVQVQTDDDTSGRVTPWKQILQDARFPQRGSFFGQGGSGIGVADVDSELILWHIRAESETSTYALKRLTLTYKSQAQSVNDTAPNKDKGKGGNPKDPEEEPPEIEEDFQPYGKILAWDVNEKKLVNSAGDPFEPIVITRLQRVIHMKMHLSKEDYQNANTLLKDTTNAAPIDVGDLTIKKGAGRIAGLKATRKKKNGKVYYETVITILDRSDDPDGWTLRLLDVGCNKLDPLSPIGKSPILVNGIPVKICGLFNGQPTKLPAILDFEPYEKRNWDAFGGIFGKEQAKG